MKPKKVTVESEKEERQKAFCDLVLSRAAHMMATDAEAPVAMILDRILTYAAAQACVNDGSAKTAEAFRFMAKRIDDGLFHSVSGEARKSH